MSYLTNLRLAWVFVILRMTERTDDQSLVSYETETFNSLNPKLFISYSLTNDIRLYFNAAQGFRSGGFNPAGLPAYDPEEVISYELGTKMELLDGRLKTEFAVFFSDYQDYQINGVDLSVSTSNILSNSGSVDVPGS